LKESEPEMKKNSAKTAEDDRIVWSPAPVPDKSRLAALGENGQELHGVPTLQTRYLNRFREGPKNARLMIASRTILSRHARPGQSFGIRKCVQGHGDGPSIISAPPAG
jgi:hypothetical protein